MIQTLMVECKYGWWQTLRLYQDRIELHGISYSLSDLVYFRPVYRSLMGISIMRLELQFNNSLIHVRNITDVHAGLQVTLYLNRWLNALAMRVQEEDVPESSSLPSSLLSSNSQPFDFEAVRSWPWTEECYEQRMQRLKELQAERELKIHGFDVSALQQQLRYAGLPCVSVPLHMTHGEVAHYRTETMLCDDAPATVHLPGARRKGKDRGTLILTNKRVVFLGRKRQIILYYERLLQISQLPGAMMLHAEYWAHQQYFVMQRPLECTIYFEHILQKLQQSPRVEHATYQLPSPS